MPDFLTSLLRTYVPIAVGALVSWLLTLGIELDAETQAGLIVALTGLSQAAYYALVRALEPHLPDWLKRALLGSAKAPLYVNTIRDGAPIVAGRVLPDAETAADITPYDNGGVLPSGYGTVHNTSGHPQPLRRPGDEV